MWKRKFKEIVTCPPIIRPPCTRYGTVLWIRIRLDPKFLAGSGKSPSGSGTKQLWIRNEIEVKLLKKTNTIWQSLNENAQKIKTSFLLKNYSPKKLTSS